MNDFGNSRKEEKNGNKNKKDGGDKETTSNTIKRRGRPRKSTTKETNDNKKSRKSNRQEDKRETDGQDGKGSILVSNEPTEIKDKKETNPSNPRQTPIPQTPKKKTRKIVNIDGTKNKSIGSRVENDKGLSKTRYRTREEQNKVLNYLKKRIMNCKTDMETQKYFSMIDKLEKEVVVLG